MDAHDIIICPIVTEAIFDEIEKFNKLVFRVDRRANKKQIKKAVEILYEVKVMKVNTAQTFQGTKKAYIRLEPEYDAMELATEFGLF